MILALGLALVLASVKHCFVHLLAGGVDRGDVEQVTGGPGLQIAKLVNQNLIGCSREERAGDVRIDDIRKRVATL